MKENNRLKMLRIFYLKISETFHLEHKIPNEKFHFM